MHCPEIPKELRTKRFCPTCGDDLNLHQCADPWAICLACEGDHRFFIMPPTPRAVDTAKASSFPEMSTLSPSAIASFWLTDPHARRLLNEQLAHLLRATLESRHVLDEPSFLFCPICRETLAEYEQPNIWVQGLCCQRSHCWALRGGHLFSAMANMRFELHAEYSDAAVGQLIAGWLKGGAHLRSNLHESIRRVLMSSPLCPPDALNRTD